jgi:hypothetical protein
MPRTLAAAAAALSSLPLAAQQPDELSRLRDEHERAVASAVRMVDDVYRLTLRQVEKQRAEAANYEGAQRAKEKLDALDKRLGSGSSVTRPPPYVLLLAARSQTRDGANADSSRQFIDFKKVGGKAVWEVLTLEQGVYEVFLTYSVGVPSFVVGDPKDPAVPAVAGGVISFSEVTGLSAATAAPLAPLEKKIVPTGSWDNFIRESLGRYEFKRTSATVRVEAEAVEAGGLMRLRQVELVRVSGAGAAAGGMAVNPAQALKELRLKHGEAITTASEEVQRRFGAEFEQLEQQFAATGDHGAAKAVAQARRDLFNTLEAGKPEDQP